jgi:glycosyltransferase involved in cell wall biosynthesis
LGREKNPSLALDAFARCAADAHLVIVGAGVERAALERAAVSAAPGRVHFAGEQPRDALPDIYATADVFLFTSVTETQGIVLLEALAAGLPIVAVDMPQTREVTGESARFCAPDAEALAENLRAVFAQEHDSRERSLAVVRRYEAGALVSRMIDVYASVLS